jgi:hypothetical protein
MLSVTAGFALGVILVVNHMIMRFSIKPDGRQAYWNPGNAIFYPEDLTERGVRALRRSGWSLLGFMACLILAFLFAISGGAPN